MILSRTVKTQPATANIGDSYIVPLEAIGPDWAGKDGLLAEATSEGWQFQESQVGALLYIADEDRHCYRNASGEWDQQ
jgi:hypothetical protein